MDIPYTVSARPDTGLYNAKVGIWLFLASEVMLFGGLFSSYIFLRVGADYHWPVHELNVGLGFLNTLVLIVSSVTIVMAWASIKLRRFGQYKLCMAITVACAGFFMINKTLEYKAKFEHYAVKLTDGTFLTGHLPEGYEIKFGEVNQLSLTFQVNTSAIDADPLEYVLPYIVEGTPTFKTEDGAEISLDKKSYADLKAKALQTATDEGKNNKTIKLTTSAPLSFRIKPSKLLSYTENSLTFRDGSIASGKLKDDGMVLEVDGVDTRSVPDAEKSLAWRNDYLGEPWKKQFIATRDKHAKDFDDKYGDSRDPKKSATLQKNMYFLHIKSAKPEATDVSHGNEKSAAASASHDEGDHGHAHHPVVKIEKKDIAFFSNYTPKLNTYYAIYFTLTGLHGLHVVAGALVLAYFLVFNGRMLKENPEHLANRVEVGGLFWHFVDLVWIFLFPLLYLL